MVTWWREILGAPPHYTAGFMPQSGATETVAWGVSPPSAVLEVVLAFASEASLVVELRSQTKVGEDHRPESAASSLGVRARRKDAVGTGQGVPRLKQLGGSKRNR